MKGIAIAVAVALLAGCAASPQQVVTTMDTRGERYDTAECRAARQMAMGYDDNVGGRMGIGLALGLFLGPFGIPLAMAVDGAQASKRDAVITELRKHCEGPLPTAYKAPAGRTDLQIKLEILDDLRAKGLLTDSEYTARKVKLTE
jgi:hypothetical protein